MSDLGAVAVLLVAIVVGGVWLALLLPRPRLLLAGFLVLMVAVPVWVELPIPGLVALPPAAVAAIVMIPAAFARSSRNVGGIGRVDLLLGVFMVLALVAVLLFGTPRYALAAAVTQWLPAYVLGRRLAPHAGLRFTHHALALAGTGAALWGLLELATGAHLFENFAGNALVSWQEIQVRGTAARSEAAFGHSIALGGFIVLTAPFVVTAAFRKRTRLAMLVVLTGGAFSTQSRAALIGLAISVVLTAWALRSEQLGKAFRLNLRLITIGSVAVLVPLSLRLFASAGAELGQSTDYRSRLTQFALIDLNPVGVADRIQTDSAGRTFYRSFLSIDNEFLLAALQFGWLPVAVLVVALLGASLRLAQRRGSAADVALVASTFVLATVAFITQYTMAFWFVAGLSVAIAQMPGGATVGDADEGPVPNKRVRQVRVAARRLERRV